MKESPEKRNLTKQENSENTKNLKKGPEERQAKARNERKIKQTNRKKLPTRCLLARKRIASEHIEAPFQKQSSINRCRLHSHI